MVSSAHVMNLAVNYDLVTKGVNSIDVMNGVVKSAHVFVIGERI